MRGTIVAVCASRRKGVRKRNVGKAELRADWGLIGDAHAGNWHRQVSLLALESIEKMRRKGLNVGPGSFAENLTTKGLDLLSLPIGSRVRVGEEVVLEITQHGKVCHDRCAIYEMAGDCVMPREGVFARVIRGGWVKVGDAIEALDTAISPDANR
ncbi:MAG TPA: MOSC domain-containing protein [Anaerolineae bacterium]|nr:MOSC domain-containing protein [Anaerolineae bacterium]